MDHLISLHRNWIRYVRGIIDQSNDDLWIEIKNALDDFCKEASYLPYYELALDHNKYFSLVGITKETILYPPFLEDYASEALETKSNLKLEALKVALEENSQSVKDFYYHILLIGQFEIQKVYYHLYDQISINVPWIEVEQIKKVSNSCLNCGCGQYLNKVYKAGEIKLPIHEGCLCYKKPLYMHTKNFLIMWQNNHEAFSRYAKWLGCSLQALSNPVLIKGGVSNVKRLESLWVMK